MRRGLAWAGGILATLVLLVGLVLVGLDTGPGKRFLLNQLGGFTSATGLNYHASGIDGSIYGRMTIHNLEISDLKGVFATVPALVIDWNPGAYISNGRLAIKEASADVARLLRMPVLKPSDPNTPLLPNLDIDIDKMRVGQLVLEPAITGRRHILALSGSTSIADGRAMVSLDANAQRGPGVAGGDTLVLRLDAVPAANRLVIDARLVAPAGGMIDGFAGLGRPLTARIAGTGSWADWRGKLTASSSVTVANLAITAADGRFTVRGPTDAGVLLPGPAASLLRHINVDVVAKLAARRVDTVAKLSSDTFVIDVKGLIDLADSRFGKVEVAAQLLRPGAIAPDLKGNDVRLAATIDGDFGTPAIAYRISAKSLTFGGITAEGLVANGRAKVDSQHILVPVSARVRRVTGLNVVAGRPLTNLGIDGDLAWSNGTLLSDNLRLRSDQLNAKAAIVADIAKGQYTGTLNGRVNDYQLAGVGRFDLVTDAKLFTAPGGGFGIAGKARITTRQIENATLRQQLGGNAVVTADFSYAPTGFATLRSLQMTAPKLRITDAHGSYSPDTGRISMVANANADSYGPAAITASGTLARPVAKLSAPRPGLGLNVRNLVAKLTGTPAGYYITANAASAYGPLTAEILAHTGKTLTIDINRARVAGIDARGSIRKTAAGPFAGNISLAGSGITGSVVLAAAGANQRAEIAARAQSARIPGGAPIAIGTGAVRATIIIYPDATSIVGTANVSKLRSGTLQVASARGRFNYRGGNGSVALIANGNSSAPFNISAQASLAPERIVANATGAFSGVDFSLASPAVATRSGKNWQLAPTAIVFKQGRIRVSGSYGAQTRLSAALFGVDLAVVNSFVPDLGLGGLASGTIDATLADVPVVDARIDVTDFTRTAAFTISAPVDLATSAHLSGDGGSLAAAIRRGSTTLGRLRAHIAPLAAGNSITARLLASPLSGGIRYTGPAEVLWAMTGIAGQKVSGPIAIAANFGGRPDTPSLNGTVRATALRYTNQKFGTVISDIALQGSFSQSQLQIASLNGSAGDGKVSASGTIGFDSANGFPADVKISLDRAQLAKGNSLGAEATGKLQFTNGAGGALLKGDITIPEARYQIIRQEDATVAQLSGVHRKNAPPPAKDSAPSLPGLASVKLDIQIRADNRIFLSGMGLEAEWQTNMHITGTVAAPRVVGRLQVVRGTYSFAGRRFELAQSGVITFDGGDFTNPELSLSAQTTVNDVTATINISGFAQRPQISFTSTPTLPQDEVLSRLLFGASVTNISPIQAVQLAAAFNSLRGSGGGLNPLGKLRSVAGIDRLRVLGADKTSGRGTAVAAGKYISNSIYIEIITDARGFTATQLEIALTKTLSLLSSTGSFGGSNVKLQYSKDY